MRHLITSATVIAASLSLSANVSALNNSSLRSHLDNSSAPVQTFLHSDTQSDLNTSYLLKRGIANFNEGDMTTASMLLHRSLRSDPFNPVANYYMGLTKKKQGNMKRAVRHLTYANKVFANAPQSYAVLGEVYVALGRIEDADALIGKLDSVQGAKPADVQAAKRTIQAAIAR